MSTLFDEISGLQAANEQRERAIQDVKRRLREELHVTDEELQQMHESFEEGLQELRRESESLEQKISAATQQKTRKEERRNQGPLGHPDLIAITLMEIPQTLFCLILPFLVQMRSKWRHPIQIINAVMQAYGAVVYFLVPYLRGSWWIDFQSKDISEHFIFVYSLNGLWIVVPTILIIQSCFAIVNNLRDEPTAKSAQAAKIKKN